MLCMCTFRAKKDTPNRNTFRSKKERDVPRGRVAEHDKIARLKGEPVRKSPLFRADLGEPGAQVAPIPG